MGGAGVGSGQCSGSQIELVPRKEGEVSPIGRA